MRFPFNPRVLPRLSLLMGCLGLALQIWLQNAGIDEKGLLNTGHPANILVFVLTAVFLLLLAAAAQPLTAADKYAKLFPASPRRALGAIFGGIGMLYGGIFMHLPLTDILSIILLLLGILAAAAMTGTAFCRLKGLRPNFLLPTAITLYMMLHTVAECRNWNALSQVEEYFFPLMSCVFLLLTCYQASLLNLQRGSRRQYVFYSQAALFFCLLSATSHTVFYLCMAGWLALDLCSLRTPRIGKFLKEDHK